MCQRFLRTEVFVGEDGPAEMRKALAPFRPDWADMSDADTPPDWWPGDEAAAQSSMAAAYQFGGYQAGE